MKKALPIGILLCVIIAAIVIINPFKFGENKEKEEATKQEEVVNDKEVDLLISFAGDCTFGNYAGQGMAGTFNQEYLNQGKDTTYFLRNVKDVFAQDDLTVVNLEGPITTATNHAIKKFAFSGDPDYVNILTSSSVEVCSLANNHSEDYFEVGMNDTKKYLDEVNVGHFGYEEACIKDVNGIKCGFLGYRSLSMTMNTEEGRAKIKAAIKNLKEEENCQLVFVYYHWGIERQYYANEDQRSLAHFTIDAGADAVIGSHPHVVQGTETYKGKPIAYSLGNFCFGGNKNPSDKDSMIYQLKYHFKGTEQVSQEVNIIPCSVSSSYGRNNYQPRILTGNEGQRVLDKIQKYSY